MEIAKADSLKNHLASLFNEWLHLHNYAEKISKIQLIQRLKKHENLIDYMRDNSTIKPHIDAYTLITIVEKYFKRLRESISEIKRMCQKNDIKGAIRMRQGDLNQFKTQLQEMELRSGTTRLLGSYLVPIYGSRLESNNFQFI